MATLEEIIEKKEKETTVIREIKLVIDGVDIPLDGNGSTKKYGKWKEPDKYGADANEGDAPLIVSVYTKKGWRPTV